MRSTLTVKTIEQRLGALDVTTLTPTSAEARSAVILCHGFGAPGDDLVSLADALVAAQPALSQTAFYFPHAPLQMAGLGDARAWWMISNEDFARFQGHQHDPKAYAALRAKPPDGLVAARGALSTCIDNVMAQTRLAAHRLVLGGFSQGAMLSTDVALRLEEPVGGLAILSGTLLLDEQWRTLSAKRTALPVFQSHGRSDLVLPFFAAESLHQLLRDNGLSTQFEAFDGGHTIPQRVVTALAAFLATSLGEAVVTSTS